MKSGRLRGGRSFSRPDAKTSLEVEFRPNVDYGGRRKSGPASTVRNGAEGERQAGLKGQMGARMMVEIATNYGPQNNQVERLRSARQDLLRCPYFRAGAGSGGVVFQADVGFYSFS